MKFFLILGCLLSVVVLQASVETSAPLSTKIDQLLLKLEKSPCKFIRNGSEHTGKEAAEHIRTKYNYFKKQIHSVEDFIAKCATKSEFTGKFYMVKIESGEIIRADNWIRKMISREDAAK